MRILRYQHKKSDNALLHVSCALQFEKQYTIGRSSKNTFVIKNEKSISRQHIIFEWIFDGKEIWITNMGKLSYLDDVLMAELEGKRVDTTKINKFVFKLGTKPVIVELNNLNCSMNIGKDDPLIKFGIKPIDFESLDENLDNFTDNNENIIISNNDNINPFRLIYYLLAGIKIYHANVLTVLNKNLSLDHDNFDEIWNNIINSDAYVMSPEKIEGSDITYIYMTNKYDDEDKENIKIINLLKNGKICYNGEELEVLLKSLNFKNFCIIMNENCKLDNNALGFLEKNKHFSPHEIVDFLLNNTLLSSISQNISLDKDSDFKQVAYDKNLSEIGSAHSQVETSITVPNDKLTDLTINVFPDITNKDSQKDINPTPLKKRKLNKRKVKSLNPFDFFAGGNDKPDTSTNNLKENDTSNIEDKIHDKPSIEKPKTRGQHVLENNLKDKYQKNDVISEKENNFSVDSFRVNGRKSLSSADSKSKFNKSSKVDSQFQQQSNANRHSNSIDELIRNSQTVKTSSFKYTSNEPETPEKKPGETSSIEDDNPINYKSKLKVKPPSPRESQVNKSQYSDITSQLHKSLADHNTEIDQNIIEPTIAKQLERKPQNNSNVPDDSLAPFKNYTSSNEQPTLKFYRPPTLVETIKDTKDQEIKRIKTEIVQVDEKELTEEAINQLGNLSIVEVKTNLIRQRPRPKESDSMEYKGRKNFKKFVKVWPKSQQNNNSVINHAYLITRSYIPLKSYSKDNKNNFDDMDDIGARINEEWAYSKEESIPEDSLSKNNVSQLDSHNDSASEDEMNAFSFNRTKKDSIVKPLKRNGLFVSDEDEDEDEENGDKTSNKEIFKQPEVRRSIFPRIEQTNGTEEENEKDDTEEMENSGQFLSRNNYISKRDYIAPNRSVSSSSAKNVRTTNFKAPNSRKNFSGEASNTMTESSDDDDDDGPKFKFRRTK